MAIGLLVVDDDRETRELLDRQLSAEGFKVRTAADGWEALRSFSRWTPDLVILDIAMPGLDGHEVCRRLRAFSQVPVSILSGRAEITSVIRGLELGADAYIIKPIDSSELAARVRSLLRRTSQESETVVKSLRVGHIQVDFNRRLVSKLGLPVPLSPTEFDLLAELARNLGKVVTQRRLLSSVWGPECIDDLQYVRLYIRYLRQKLEDDPARPRYIRSEWGVGYRLEDPDTWT